MKKLTFIDLFAGGGGLSEGFVKAGYEALAHIEMDEYACQTLRTRAAFHWLKENDRLDVYVDYLKCKKEGEDGRLLWKEVPNSVMETVIKATINEETIDAIFKHTDTLIGDKSVDLIIGGPPCQAYSYAGRARIGKAIESDPRNDLYLFYVRFLEKYKPKMFVFENVLGIKTAKGGLPYNDLKSKVREIGYEIEDRVQVASEHGVLQNRERVIFVGWRKFDSCNLPTNYHYPELKKKPCQYQTRKDLFSDLPERKAGEGTMTEIVEYTKSLSEMQYLKETGIRGVIPFTTQHVVRNLNDIDREIYQTAVQLFERGIRLDYSKLPERLQKHKNKTRFKNRFCVVNPNGPSHTLVAHISNDGHYYIFPSENSTLENVRSLSVREAARIQTFPDDYFFEGSRTSVLKQIGNAVPVILAYRIALALKEQLL